MGEYRTYELRFDGKIGKPHDIVADLDAEALSKPLELTGTYSCEIWEGKRLVARVPGPPAR